MLPSLSIVIPAYNEAASIAATIADAFAVGKLVTEHLEVVVCNDGSRDDTAAIVRTTDARMIDRSENRGIEATMRELYANAHHDWIFLMSADRQWPMTTLLPMAEAVERGADFVVGARANKRSVYTPYRRIVSWGYERLVRALGAPTGDPGSIKLARRELLDVPVVARGVFAEGERIIRAARSGAKVVEVPVEFHKRGAGKATGARAKVVATALADGVRVSAALLRGRR